jgi:ABC-2 type transport system ATP-binding protein
MSEKRIMVQARGVKKTFRIPLDGSSGIKQKLINSVRGKKGYREFTPLDGISFEIGEGEFFGIVGKNGSGKSTLLKTLAGIYIPNEGDISINGSLVPFIELGVGFNPELSGKENVYLNGALLGFSKREVDEMYDEIVSFAELGEFMEERLKNYSSGMQVRLAFSIAIQAHADILLLDEVLAVGDAAFQQKCYDYFERLKREKRTIIIVTHDMAAVKRFCTRAMLISEGKIEMIGTPEEVADLYTEENIERMDDADTEEEFDTQLEAKLKKRRFKRTDAIEIDVSYVPPDDDLYFVNISLMSKGAVFADTNTKYLEGNDVATKSKRELVFKQSLEGFNSGQYDVCVTIHRKADDRMIEQKVRAATFLVTGYDPSLDGPMRLEGKWHVTK